MKRIAKVVVVVAWCTLIVGPMSAHWPFFCKLVGWGVNFPGRGWTP